MDWIIAILAIIILPSILILLTPIIDKVFSTEVIDFINGIIDYIEYFIGSTNTNILFAMIWLLIAIPFIRRLFHFFSGESKA